MKADRQVNAFFQLQVLTVLLLYAIWSRSVVGVSVGDVTLLKCYHCRENITDLTNISTTKCGSVQKNCNTSTYFCGAFTNLTGKKVLYVEDCFPHHVCANTSVGCSGTCHAACCQDDSCNNYLSTNTNISQLIRNYFSMNPTVPTNKSNTLPSTTLTVLTNTSNTLPSESPSDKNPSVTKSPSSATRNTCCLFTWMPMLPLWILVATPALIKI